MRGCGPTRSGISGSDWRPDQRTLLFTAALSETDGENGARALIGMGAGVNHLSEPQRSRFLVKVLAQDEVLVRLSALTGPSGDALAFLSGDQREALFTELFAIDDDEVKPVSFHVMTAGLAHLDEGRRDRFVQTVVAFTDEWDRSGIVGALGPALAHLTPDHREQLGAAAVALIDTEDLTAALRGGEAIGGLVAGLPVPELGPARPAGRRGAGPSSGVGQGDHTR